MLAPLQLQQLLTHAINTLTIPSLEPLQRMLSSLNRHRNATTAGDRLQQLLQRCDPPTKSPSHWSTNQRRLDCPNAPHRRVQQSPSPRRQHQTPPAAGQATGATEPAWPLTHPEQGVFTFQAAAMWRQSSNCHRGISQQRCSARFALHSHHCTPWPASADDPRPWSFQ